MSCWWAWAVLDRDVDNMKPAIVKNAQAIEKVDDRVVEVEKDVIGVKGSVEALRVQQEGYHRDGNEKHLELLAAIKKANESP